jgi:ketosteroid isomerase-like protein
MDRSFGLTVCAAAAMAWATAAPAVEPDRQADEKAIRATAEQYVAALARGDAKAALGYWTAEGDIVDETGRRSTARERIEQDVAGATDSGDATQVTPLAKTTIRFLGSDSAIEDGTYGEGASGRFVAVWTRADGRWRLAGLRESRNELQPLAVLADLDWLAGRWIGEHDGTTYEITARWNEPQTYLERTLTATHNGTVLLKAQQRIGVDPVDNRVKSWIHDVEGGRGEGTWSKLGASWVVETRGIAADGEDVRGASVYTPEGSKQIHWESLDNWRGGRPLLDFDVTLSRAAESGS